MTESTDGAIRKHRGLVMCGLFLTWLILACPMTSLPARAADNCPTVAVCCTLAHNKVSVIDGETVIGGSFNYTKAAQDKHAENVEITRDKTVAAKHTANWQAHARHSERYVGGGVAR
jgi:phosphatidylserine/phosphatidylglycerophosphate/cardiolipin synthase-like enzyme